MKKITLFSAAVLVLMLGLTGAAEAQTYAVPCFEWDCSAGDGNCDFDASCSGTGGIWKYNWDFGDGNTANGRGVPTVSHFYPGGANANVTLTLTFFGKPDESITCNVVYRNVIGPPDPLFGTCD